MHNRRLANPDLTFRLRLCSSAENTTEESPGRIQQEAKRQTYTQRLAQGEHRAWRLERAPEPVSPRTTCRLSGRQVWGHTALSSIPSSAVYQQCDLEPIF